MRFLKTQSCPSALLSLLFSLGLPGGSMVKNLPARQETWVRSLGWEDSLEKGMATHSSILGWRILWTEEPGGLRSMGSQRVGHDWATELNWAHGKDSDAGKDKAGEGNDRGWDGWMTSLMRWTWVWLSSESWWWTGEPGVLQSMGSQSQIQLSNSTELNWACKFS